MGMSNYVIGKEEELDGMAEFHLKEAIRECVSADYTWQRIAEMAEAEYDIHRMKKMRQEIVNELRIF